MSASLFAGNGNLYATFDAERLNPVSGDITTVISNNLYQIDPSTGLATIVAATAQALSAVVQVNGTA
jgi:hypothetical protein